MQREESSRLVAVTGMGAVCGLGWGVDALWEGLRAGRSGDRPLPPLRSLPAPHPPRRRGAPSRRQPAAALAPRPPRLAPPVDRRPFRPLRRPRGGGAGRARVPPKTGRGSGGGGLLRQQHGRHVRERALLRGLPARPPADAPLGARLAAGQRARRRGGPPPRGDRAGRDALLRLRLGGAGARRGARRRCARARWRSPSPAARTRSASSPTPGSTPCARSTRSPAGRSAPAAPACRSARGRRCWCSSRSSGRWRAAPSRSPCSPAPAPPATPIT